MMDCILREKSNNYILWDEINIIDKECNWKVTKIKEAA